MKGVGNKKGLVCFGLLGLILMVASPAASTTLLSMDMEALTTNSDAVIEGRVVSVESFWDPTGRVILSEAVIQVTEAVTGKADRRVRVQTFGGQVGDFTVEAHGFPNFRRGNRVVLFINKREALDGAIRVTGHQLGHYRIVRRGRDDVAVPTLDNRVQVVRGPAPVELPLNALKAQVRDIAARGGKN